MSTHNTGFHGGIEKHFPDTPLIWNYDKPYTSFPNYFKVCQTLVRQMIKIYFKILEFFVKPNKFLSSMSSDHVDFFSHEAEIMILL